MLPLAQPESNVEVATRAGHEGPLGPCVLFYVFRVRFFDQLPAVFVCLINIFVVLWRPALLRIRDTRICSLLLRTRTSAR